MADIFGGVLHWKKLWQLTAGFNNESTTELVSNKLTEAQQQLEDGLLQYKPSSTESLDKVNKKLNLQNNVKLQNFVKRLHQLLGIDALQVWDLLCYYLVNEFRGSPTALVDFTMSESRVAQLIIDIWGFYSSERMFMLKLLGVIIEYNNDPKHPYNQEYYSIVQKITFDKIRASLIKQFQCLIRETVPTVLENGEICTPYFQKLWAERNMREQVQVLHLLILTINESHIAPTELATLLDLFKEHNFGRQPFYLRFMTDAHNAALNKIIYSEVALFLACVDMTKIAESKAWISQATKLLDSKIASLHYNEEHGAILLAWMLLNVQANLGEEIFMMRYSQFGTKAVQLQVFSLLHKLVTHVMFKDKSKTAMIVYQTIYNHMNVMCHHFDHNGNVSQQPLVFDLVSELLNNRKIAEQFIKDEDQGLRSIFNTAMELFPLEFIPLSKIATGIAKSGPQHNLYILEQISNLPVFTELYDPSKIHVIAQEIGSENYTVAQNYSPLPHVDFTITNSSEAVILDRKNQTLIHFRTTNNYWTVLHSEILQLFDETLRGNSIVIHEKLLRVHSGIKLIANSLKWIKNPSDIPDAMVQPTEMIFDVILKFMRVQNAPVDVLATCLEVLTALVPLFGREIQTRLCNIGLLPFINNINLSYSDYVVGETFHSSISGYYLMNYGRNTGKYEYVISYFNLLNAFFKFDINNVMAIELPGLIFMLREVFPHISTWYFEDELERQKISYQCIQYFFNILQFSTEQLQKNTEREILYKTCIHSLLNVENGTALLKIIAVGNPYLQALMEEQTNWVAGPGIQYIRLVQISMSTLMQILRLKHLVLEKHSSAPLEHLIYTQPKQKDTLRIVPVVTGYMNHVFNKFLPSLACRLLKRFALEIQMSLMSCLDMEPDQIRQMFLQRLRDDSESDELKTAILELVASCVERQPGLTEAFFKVYHPQDQKKIFYRPSNDDIAEGILSYMAEYLSAVHSEPNRLYSPLLSRIMGLFHALWKNHMEMLVSDFRKNTNFWKFLTSPLFHDILPDIKAYSQILNIIGIEVFQSQGDVDSNLQKSLETLLNPNEPHFKKWVNHIFNIPTSSDVTEVVDETPEWLCLLTSWKDFITICIRLLHFEIADENKSIMVERCLDVLVEQVELMNDSRAVVLLSELLMILLSRWKNKCFEKSNHDQIMNQVTKLLHSLNTAYNVLHPRAKDSILTSVIISMNVLSESLKKNSRLSDDLVDSSCKIICYELNEVFDESNNKKYASTANKSKKMKVSYVERRLLPAVLSFNVLNQILLIFPNGFDSWAHSLSSTCIINRILTCLKIIIPMPSKVKVTESALETLMLLSRSIFSRDLLNCEIGQYLWLALLQPANMDQKDAASTKEKWHSKDWWPVFTRGIQLVRILLEVHEKTFSSDAIIFVGVQEEYLVEAISLVRTNLEPQALDLTVSALQLIDQLVKYSSQWTEEHSHSVENIMRNIQSILDYTVYLIYRPRVLRCYIDGVQADLSESSLQPSKTKLSEKVIAVINRFVELISLSSRCLLAFSPSVFNLLTETQLNLSKYKPIVELQFGAPKLHKEPDANISFGTMLSAACIFTKVLSVSYTPKGKIIHKLNCSLIQNESTASAFTSTITEKTPPADKSSFSISIKQTTQALTPLSPAASLSTTSSSLLLTNDWLTTFNVDQTIFALESVMTFIASQALFALRHPSNTSREQQLIRRELSSELSSYHDFVKKKVLDLFVVKNNLIRKKLGTCSLVDKTESNETSTTTESKNTKTPPPVKRTSSDNCMRVSVVRKQHLEASKVKKISILSTPDVTQRPDFVNVSTLPSPITPDNRNVVHGGKAASTAIKASDSISNLLYGIQGIRSVSNKPYVSMRDNTSENERVPAVLSPGSAPRLDISRVNKTVTWSPDLNSSSNDSPCDGEFEYPASLSFTRLADLGRCSSKKDEVIMYPPEDATDRYCPLTDVQMSEEDYLHLLSNLFMYICPTDSY